jgi:uncharacterized membrane protein (UPF0136 family)
MPKNAILVGLYGIIVLMGGIIGFIVANSVPSLVMSALFSVLIFFTVHSIYRGNTRGLVYASLLAFLLTLFFSYRFFISLKVMPAGFMFFISLALFFWLLRQLLVINKGQKI